VISLLSGSRCWPELSARVRNFRHAAAGFHHAYGYGRDRTSRAHAQQGERVRRIGALIGGAEILKDEPTRQRFSQGCSKLGWTDGRNGKIEFRWARGSVDEMRKYAAEFVALAPDVILAGGGSVVLVLQQAAPTVPIVVHAAPDPVGAGYVDSLARPGGNATGFMALEYGVGAKWLELLKQVAPAVTR
jgi:putative ABC transport system substrate-binding protein